MVAVRSAHLSPASKLSMEEWITSLSLSNLQSSKQQLAKTWNYYEQLRKNHPNASLILWRSIEMVEIISMLGMDIDGLCAALLFPLADAGIVEDKVLESKSSKNIIDLIHGVRDMDIILQLRIIRNNLVVPTQVDNIHRILLTLIKDCRCIIIKLAERIVHLRELRNAPEGKRVLAAKEVVGIYAPLANRIGIGQLKWELEDFCFRYLYPEDYKSIAILLHDRRIDREQYIDAFVSALHNTMQKEGLKAEVYGRPKHIYSIWRKMRKKTLEFDELFDVHAVRVIVEHLQDCYTVLGVVHGNFRYLPNEFDDYVVNPKPNGYQSIHTVVFGPYGKTIEIQIRTRKMHEDAELGIAAHWKYKEGSIDISSSNNSYDQHFVWLRELLICNLTRLNS